MTENNESGLETLYGGRVRVRVCGICIAAGKVLLVNHAGIGTASDFWNLPGGGLEFGETARACVVREFAEETGLQVTVGAFLGIHEFMSLPLHALELFFEIKITGGTLVLGTDPEQQVQFLKEVRWFTLEALQQIPDTQLHSLLIKMKTATELRMPDLFFGFLP